MDQRHKILGRKIVCAAIPEVSTPNSLESPPQSAVPSTPRPIVVNNSNLNIRGDDQITHNDLEAIKKMVKAGGNGQSRGPEPAPWPLPYKYLQEKTVTSTTNEAAYVTENMQMVSRTTVVETVNTVASPTGPERALVKIELDEQFFNEEQYIEFFLKNMDIVDVWCRSGIYYFGFLDMGTKFPIRSSGDNEEVDVKRYPAWARKFLQSSSKSIAFSRKTFVLSLMALFNLEAESVNQLPHQGYIIETISQMCLFCAILRTEQNLHKRNRMEEMMVGLSVKVLYLALASDRDIPICQMHFYRIREKVESRLAGINYDRAIHQMCFQIQNKTPTFLCDFWLPSAVFEVDSRKVDVPKLPLACSQEDGTSQAELAFYAAANGHHLIPSVDYPLIESNSDLDIQGIISEFLQEERRVRLPLPIPAAGATKGLRPKDLSENVNDFKDNYHSFRILQQYLDQVCTKYDGLLDSCLNNFIDSGKIDSQDSYVRVYRAFNVALADYLCTMDQEFFMAVTHGYRLSAKLGAKKRLAFFEKLTQDDGAPGSKEGLI